VYQAKIHVSRHDTSADALQSALEGVTQLVDRHSRREISRRLGEAVDQLAIDLYSGIVDGVSAIQEAEISSRLCQRLEDKLDGMQAGDYTFNVIAQSVPDRGPRSMEKLFGADIFLSVSLDGPDGFDKGIFIQAKYDRNVDQSELADAVKKMQNTAGRCGSYVWIYTPGGVKVFSAKQIEDMNDKFFRGQVSRSVEGFSGRILDCFAGSRDWGIPASDPDRRKSVAARLRKARAANIVDLQLQKTREL